MSQIRVRLPELLAQRRINRKQLAEGAGLRYATVNDVYSGRRRPSLETLEAVMAGLERLTGLPVNLDDLLEVVHEPAPLHGDPDRPALDTANLKTFRLRERGPQPAVTMPSEVLVAQLRGRA